MPTSSCVASQLCNVTLPTRLGLQPIALHPYTNLGNITLFWLSDYPTFAYIARAIQFSLELWVNSFSCLQYLLFAPNQREQARYHYQSKLFNICTRTPIGDLVGMVGLEPTTHFFLQPSELHPYVLHDGLYQNFLHLSSIFFCNGGL